MNLGTPNNRPQDDRDSRASTPPKNAEKSSASSSRNSGRILSTEKTGLSHSARRVPRRKKKNPWRTVLSVIGHTLLFVLILLGVAVGSLFAFCNTIANGPSVTMRDQLVLSAMQASATKWVPGLFLDDDVVQAIVDASHVEYSDPIPIDSMGQYQDSNLTGTGGEKEVWIDGLCYLNYSGPTFRAYILLVRDPGRVYVATAENGYEKGLRIFEMAEKENAAAIIYGGEYVSPDATYLFGKPIGTVFSKGVCVYDRDGIYNHTFIGLDKNNRLIVREPTNNTDYTPDKLREMGIRDSVCFQTNNVLLSYNEAEGSILPNYQPGNTGAAQRTAIGQRLDGTIVMVVTDGRTASSLGATHDDMVNLMIKLGAVTAAKLDGGSSSMMYYRDYWDKIDGVDYESLDEYQKKGLINKYKAFTEPFRMPTYFVVAPLDQAE